MSISLSDPLTLPCGAVLSNRIAKAAMTEGMATPDGRPTEALDRLYGLWSDGGAGMLLSGNIIIDKDHLERPGNVIIDREPDADMQARLARWAAAATRGGNHFWAQISHGGRQTQKPVNPAPRAPSAVRVDLPGGMFGQPVALTSEEVADLPGRWALAARACQQAGFTGVQIHGAHGYLISQFLSPRTNLRADAYGGSLENRARLLIDTVAAVRAAVGPGFPVSVKLNSADFQKGGFEFEDSLKVVKWLEAASVDLIEISGGTYEQPALLGAGEEQPEAGANVAASTAAREAYFVDFAKAMQAEVSVPLMVTGGFRSRAAMELALGDGAADLIGIGRPMCLMTDAPRKLLEGADSLPRYEEGRHLIPAWLGFLRATRMGKAADGFGVIFWFYQQLWLIGQSGAPDPGLSVFSAYRTLEARNRRILSERPRS
ncbi:MAG: NADH:flavin oxidoreductase/NADH oxidase family protein [Blastomonas sp.]